PRRVPARAHHDRGLLLGEDPADAADDPPGQDGAAQVAPPRAPIDRLERQQVVPERIAGQDVLFDAPLRSHEHRFDVRPQARERLGEREGGHEMAASASAGKEHLHSNAPMRNAEWGMRSRTGGSHREATAPSPFRIPHSAFRIHLYQLAGETNTDKHARRYSA